MERLPNRYPKISQSHKVPLYKGLSLFYPKLLKKTVFRGFLSYIFSSSRSWSSKVKLLRNKSHGEIERKDLNSKSWSW